MRWQRFSVSAVVLIVVGCGSERSNLAAGETVLPVAVRPDPDPLSVSRLQKPDGEVARVYPSGSILTVGNHEFHDPPECQVQGRIRAVVNDTPILDDEVREATYQYLVQTLSMPEPERTKAQKEIYERELDKLIEREIILSDAFEKMKKLRPQFLEKLQEAAKKEFDKRIREMKANANKSGLNIQTDEQFKAVLRQQGLTLAGVRRQIERSFMAMEYMRSRIYEYIDRIGHEQIIEYYEEHSGEFQMEDRVTWQDIFIEGGKHPNREAARRFAEEILARVRKGEDFAALAKQYDDGMSKYNNGEGFGQRRGEIKPLEVEPMLFEMKDGEVAPLVELPTGYHIIRLVKRDYAGLRPLNDKTQEEVRKKITSMVADREFKRIVAELKRTTRVVRDDEP